MPDGDAAPPGWYPDPSGRFTGRWWDGRAWTARVALDGSEGTDPLASGVGDPVGALRQFDYEVQRRRQFVDMSASQLLHQEEQLRKHEQEATYAAVGLTLGSFGGCLSAIVFTVSLILVIALLAAIPPLGVLVLLIGSVALFQWARARRRLWRRGAQSWYRQALEEQIRYDQARQLFADIGPESIEFRAAALVFRDSTRRLIDKYLASGPPPPLVEEVVRQELDTLFAIEWAASSVQAAPLGRAGEADVELARRVHDGAQVFTRRQQVLTGAGGSGG